MTNYVPRHGDRIKVEMTVVPTGKQDTQNAALADWLVAQLAAEGKVELVARAEPDWQIGDIGQHVETGELFRYLPDQPARPWLTLGVDVSNGRYLPASRLAGKLRRMRLVPEGEEHSGSVVLVARAGPDWQPGEIGEHIETGERYALLFAYGNPNRLEWRALDSQAELTGTGRNWHPIEELTGKLRRMRLVPEGEAHS